MAHGFTEGTGFLVHEPSWHKLEGALLDDWPGSWAEARDLAKLTWEPETVGVATIEQHEGFGYLYRPASEWQGIRRSDNQALLSIQPKTYKVIENSQFGKFIEIVMGTTDLQIEALFELWGGKKVVCLVRFPTERHVLGDPSAFYTYLALVSRHDGQGGMKAIATNIRVQCANTERMADVSSTDGKDSWTIRHTENWGERLEEVAAEVKSLYDGQQPYYDLAVNLNANLLTGEDYNRRATDGYGPALQNTGPGGPKHSINDVVRRYLPIGDDMTERVKANREEERQTVLDVYYSDVCEGIRGTYWGAYQAFTHWVDHGRRYKTITSYIDRTLSPSPIKRHALRVTKKMAGV